MPTPGTRTAGSQTLARGLAALNAVVAAPDGMGIQDLADAIGVHRTIAYRILGTLADATYITRGADGRYRGATGLLRLRAAGYETLKHVALPLLSDLADELGATVSLLVAEQHEAVALTVVEPERPTFRIAFSTGSRHPLDQGAAGYALSALIHDPRPDEPVQVAEVRTRGYAITHGEVEPGAWALAMPIATRHVGMAACVNVISHREDVISNAVEATAACTRTLEQRLLETP